MTQTSEINLKTAWREAANKLKKVGVKTPLLDARLLLQYVLGITYEELLISATRILTVAEIEIYAQLIIQRSTREPVSKILGIKEFWSLDFKVTKDTLDPRPDSETLIHEVLENFKDKERPLKILDLGTGSGCLVITLLTEYKNATAVAVDKSSEALKVASENAEYHKLSDRIEFIESDWLENVEGEFDVIISNPPYIKKEAIDFLAAEVRLYDPLMALDGGEDGLDIYRFLTPKIAEHLNSHGKCFYEIGEWQEEPITQMIEENGYELNNVQKDLAGIPRIISFNKPYITVVN